MTEDNLQQGENTLAVILCSQIISSWFITQQFAVHCACMLGNSFQTCDSWWRWIGRPLRRGKSRRNWICQGSSHWVRRQGSRQVAGGWRSPEVGSVKISNSVPDLCNETSYDCQQGSNSPSCEAIWFARPERLLVSPRKITLSMFSPSPCSSTRRSVTWIGGRKLFSG